MSNPRACSRVFGSHHLTSHYYCSSSVWFTLSWGSLSECRFQMRRDFQADSAKFKLCSFDRPTWRRQRRPIERTAKLEFSAGKESPPWSCIKEEVDQGHARAKPITAPWRTKKLRKSRNAFRLLCDVGPSAPTRRRRTEATSSGWRLPRSRYMDYVARDNVDCCLQIGHSM